MTSAGLTRTAFYRYFPDLESVLLRLVEDIADELERRRPPDGSTPTPPTDETALVDAGRGLAETYRTHGRLLAAFADAAAAQPRRRRRLASRHRRLHRRQHRPAQRAPRPRVSAASTTPTRPPAPSCG